MQKVFLVIPLSLIMNLLMNVIYMRRQTIAYALCFLLTSN